MRSKDEEKELAALIAKYSPFIRGKVAECSAGFDMRGAALSFEDLFQAGVTGLIEAFDSFDESFGVPFPAYLVLKITYGVYNEYSRCIQHTKHSSAARRVLQKDVRTLETIYERSVTTEEVADFLALQVSELEKCFPFGLAAAPTVCPLGLPEIESYFSTPRDAVEKAAAKLELAGMLESAMSGLSEREHFVIRGLFFEGLTCAQVGKRLGISRQWVDVLKGEALLKMKSHLPEGLTLEDVLEW